MKTTCLFKDLDGKHCLYILHLPNLTKFLVEFNADYYCCFGLGTDIISSATENTLIEFFTTTKQWDKCPSDNNELKINYRICDDEALHQQLHLIHKSVLTSLKPEILRRQHEVRNDQTILLK